VEKQNDIIIILKEKKSGRKERKMVALIVLGLATKAC
jgi:hypothetical protein